MAPVVLINWLAEIANGEDILESVNILSNRCAKVTLHNPTNRFGR